MRVPIPDSVERVASIVVDAGFKVHKTLGPGLLESAYEHCLAHELALRGISPRRQVTLPIIYEGCEIEAAFRIDLLVSDAIVVEIKAVEAMLPIHRSQLLTYLKLSGCRLGFLMNFNVQLFKDGVRRLII